ncbi:ATPase inhibitor [Colletotrichum orbiculare MAFF 240422]|uniref:ATPase inhibitor, mitochondrial n=1 Tax=Colletotrichum orbiculare (strain 104-T / ATCC 96160 / CBS 514.97 / LARS 414 / MAFF 240422) TaxID=1213857 RepID=A0A484FJL4_COLOR|nr:ATPase inhibitor [Colletotrichum orbiculare MAFF 240422]
MTEELTRYWTSPPQVRSKDQIIAACRKPLSPNCIRMLYPYIPRRSLQGYSPRMGDGDTGAPPKMGGQGDAFQRREKASEDYAIRQREKEKLLLLKKRLAEQQAHLQQLSEHIDEITKEQGGEHN